MLVSDHSYHVSRENKPSDAILLDIVRSLETIDSPKIENLNIFLPGPGSTLEKQLQDRMNFTGRLFQTPIRLGNMSCAMRLALHLLEALVQPVTSESANSSVAGIMGDFTTALKLNGRIGRCLGSIIRRCAVSAKANIAGSVDQYIRFSSLVLVKSLESDSFGSLDAQVCNTIIEFLGVVLPDSTLSHQPQVESALYSCFEALIESQKSSKAINMTVQSVLVPRLVDAQGNDDHWADHSSSFLVNI